MRPGACFTEPHSPTQGTGVSTPLHWLDLHSIAALIAAGDLSARQVVEDCLARITRLQPSLNAFITIFADEALAEAGRADALRRQNGRLGPLHGVPIGVKDIFAIAGQRMTAGMPSRAQHVCTDTATVIRRLHQAGAIVIGSQNVAEGVFGEYLAPYGPPVNPSGADLWPGASSGGSAVAVAAGLGYGAIGSDTGGSIRMPSAVNGVTGLKPTWGRVSRHGVFELAGTLDHIGPIARNAADAALLYDAIAGSDPLDPTSLDGPVPLLSAALGQGVGGLTIGLDPAWTEDGVQPEVSAAIHAVAQVLQEQGAKLRPVSLPVLPDVVDIWYDICAAQTAKVHAESFAQYGHTYSAALSAIIRHGQTQPEANLRLAQDRQTAYSASLIKALGQVNLVAIPVLPFAPPSLAQTQNINRALIDALHRFTCPFTLSGAPGITFPGGQTAEGLPLAVQLVATPLAEDLLIRAAHAFQAVAAPQAHPSLSAN